MSQHAFVLHLHIFREPEIKIKILKMRKTLHKIKIHYQIKMICCFHDNNVLLIKKT